MGRELARGGRPRQIAHLERGMSLAVGARFMPKNAVRVGLVALLLGGCGKVEVTVDGGVDPDAAPFADGGSGVDGGVDEIPPDTSIEAAPVSPSGSATADFEFAATEDDCTFRCKLDDGPVTDVVARASLNAQVSTAATTETTAISATAT